MWMARISKVSVCCLLGIVCSAILSVAGRCQTPTGSATLDHAPPKTVEVESAVQVKLAPDRVIVDPKTQTATVMISNLSAKPVKAAIHLRYGGPHPVSVDTTASSALATSGFIVQDSAHTAALDSVRRDSLRTDSLAKLWSLAPWITDAPKTLDLKPHETRSITLHLTIPETLAPGEYSAHLIVNTAVNVGYGSVGVTGPGGQPVNIGLPTFQMWLPENAQAPAVSILIYRVGDHGR